MFQKLSFPNRITVELTNRCNVSCTFCPRQSVDMELGDMDWELYQKIIDEAAEHLPVKLVIFFRGESLLYDKFDEAIRYAKEKGLGPIQLSSNALALDEKAADMIIKNKVDFISFSLDTLDPIIYKKSRLYGDLEKSVANVIRFSEKCSALRKAGEFAPTIQVSTIELPEYLEGEDAYIEFWKKHADIVRVYYEHDDNGHFVDEEVNKRLIPNSQRQPCRKVFTDFLIYWDGRVALCNYDWRGMAFHQNVKNSTIQEIWDSKEFENIRKMHRENLFADNIMCKDCEHWKIDYVEGGFLGKMYRKEETVLC